MTGPQYPAAAGRDQLRAGHADRDEVIEVLKGAFVDGQLTKDEFGARAGRALAARTRADLTALIADLPPAPAWPGPDPAGPVRPPGAGAPLAAGQGDRQVRALPGPGVRLDV